MTGPHCLELTGDAYTRGRTHGGELRHEVTACVDFYRGILGLGEAELRERAAVFERIISAYAPLQAEEIRGIAEGAGLPASYLFAVNARSELVPFDAAECTVLCVPHRGLLAQTWDWCQQLEDLVTLLRVKRDDGHRLLTVTEPGILGKIGLSSAGVGVCLNFLSAPRHEDGVPIHNLLREALEAGSMAAAQQRLRQAGAGRGGNIMLANDSAQAVNFEFAGDHIDERPLEESFCHTNHCLFRQLPAGELEANSTARLERGRQLLRNRENPDLENLKSILSDQQDSDSPICAPYHPLFGLNLGTICTVVMDLPQRQLHLRIGSDPAGDFTVYGL